MNEEIKPVNKGGAPKGNKNNLKYPKKKAVELFENILNLLITNEDIFTETELMRSALIHYNLPFRSYHYLLDEKFPVELRDFKEQINSILESRLMKSKELYPTIANLALKNKHGWRDEKKLDVQGETFNKIEIVLVKPDESD